MGCSASSHELPPPVDVSPASSHEPTPPRHHVEQRSLPPSFTRSITSSTTRGGEGGCDDSLPLFVVASSAAIHDDAHQMASRHPAAVAAPVAVIPVLLLRVTEGGIAAAAGTTKGCVEPVSYSMEVSNLQLLASIRAQASGGSVGQYSVSDAPLVEIVLLSEREVW